MDFTRTIQRLAHLSTHLNAQLTQKRNKGSAVLFFSASIAVTLLMRVVLLSKVAADTAQDCGFARLPAHLTQGWLNRRMGGAALFFVAFLAVSLLTRCALLAKSAADVAWDWSLPGAFATGLVFDAGMGVVLAALAAIALAIAPARFFQWSPARFPRMRPGRMFAWAWVAAGGGALLFGAVAEWLFWDEFGARFNFIAVDYLVYTHEVVANIRESYPIPVILAALAAVTLAATWTLARSGLVARWLDAPAPGAARRWLAAAGWAGGAAVAVLVFDADRAPKFANTYNGELARNGVWSLFAAFRNNELDYVQFYATLPEAQAFARLKTELARDGSTPLATPLYKDASDTLRVIVNPGPEQHPNVIQITVESLSAAFLGTFNPASTLTPNLDALARESLVFENFYATGTRTDRGMEALTLSLPPTPGRSIIKRPANAGLFTLGSLFRSRGYDTAFIYGGHGYFDNMNAFFGGNGYRVVDRASVASSDVTFANAWGACDEDLFRWTMREADTSAATGAPFHFFVMTTSNHRPYTFPEGRIDLPPKVSGRKGAVKYTDYAIGQFIREAAKKPWFKNTVFVIVADHCASSAGKTALPVENYHIPLLIYAPGGHIAPGRVAQVTSQIDYAPTLLGRLGWSYATRFFGWDVLAQRGTGVSPVTVAQTILSVSASHMAGTAMPRSGVSPVGNQRGTGVSPLGNQRGTGVSPLGTSTAPPIPSASVGSTADSAVAATDSVGNTADFTADSSADAVSITPAGRALIGNYQKLGYFDGFRLAVLSPLRGVAQQDYKTPPRAGVPKVESVVVPAPDPALCDVAIAYYETASWLYRHGRYRALSPEDQKRYVADAIRRNKGAGDSPLQAR